MAWQQTIVMGNLGNVPELKYLPSGKAVCNFSVAVNESWTDRQTNEKREKTTWYRAAAWGALAETANAYLTKGQPVLIVGQVQARGYINNAGEPAASLELTVKELRFVGGGQNQNGQRQSQDDYTQTQSDIDDIPF